MVLSHSMNLRQWMMSFKFSCNTYTGYYIFSITNFSFTSKVHGVDSRRFFVDFQPHYGPGVDSDSNRNDHQYYFLGGKDDHCIRLTILTPSFADCLEILAASISTEPYTPIQARNWLALPLHVLLHKPKDHPAYT